MSIQQQERFSGIARLYGVDAMAKICESHVCIVGVGGIGSWAAEALVRSGIGKITLVDLDDICTTNVNRQLHALSDNIGAQKTEVMAARLQQINPECQVVLEQRFYTAKNAESILEGNFDYLIDSIDSVNSKAHLVASCKQRTLPMICCGAAGGLHDITKIKIADMAKVENDALIKKVRTVLRNDYTFPKYPKVASSKLKNFGVKCVFSTESPFYPTQPGGISTRKDERLNIITNCDVGIGSVTHITGTFGFIAAQHCINTLIK